MVERWKIFFDELLVVRDSAGKFRLYRLKQIQSSVRRGKICPTRNVTAPCTNFRVEPNQVEINLVGLDEIFVVAVDLRRCYQFELTA